MESFLTFVWEHVDLLVCLIAGGMGTSLVWIASVASAACLAGRPVPPSDWTVMLIDPKGSTARTYRLSTEEATRVSKAIRRGLFR